MGSSNSSATLESTSRRLNSSNAGKQVGNDDQKKTKTKGTKLVYVAKGGSPVSLPGEINCMDILGIRSGSGKYEFQSQILTPNRQRRALLSLAYHAHYSIFNGDTKAYSIVEKGICNVNYNNLFVLCATGDCQKLHGIFESEPSMLYEQDSSGATPLYIACRGGFYDVVEMMLKFGCDVNAVQHIGCTPLHVASWYGHIPIVSLLLKCGARPEIKNRDGRTALDECSEEAGQPIVNAISNRLQNFLKDAVADRQVKFVQPISYDRDIVGFRAVAKLTPTVEEKIKKWPSAWHGTKMSYLLSILRNGLRKPGARLPDGSAICVPPNHIGLGIEVKGIKTWAQALFVSPSIAYSSHAAYAERVVADGKQWCCLVNLRVRPDSFQAYPSTVIGRLQLDGEPELPEYRVQSDRDDAILRVENESICVVMAITFVLIEFLEETSMAYAEIQELFSI